MENSESLGFHVVLILLFVGRANSHPAVGLLLLLFVAAFLAEVLVKHAPS